LSDLTGEETVWRYLDLGKLIDLLESKTLYFANPIVFEDPYELSLPDYRKNLAYRREVDKLLGHIKKYSQVTKQHHLVDIVCSCTFAYYTRVNCWHINRYESAAMWYGYGLAIKSTVKRIRNSLVQSDSLEIRPVEYLDFDSQWTGKVDQKRCLSTKRISFKHEEELRLIHTISDRQFTTAINSPSVELGEIVDTILDSTNPRNWRGDIQINVSTPNLKRSSGCSST
jgi:hypothetical protein